MLFLSVRGVLDYAGPMNHSRFHAVHRVAFRNPNGVGILILYPFRSSIARPADASVYASSATSRLHPQDSRSGWIRYFLSCTTLSFATTYRFNPALPGNRHAFIQLPEPGSQDILRKAERFKG